MKKIMFNDRFLLTDAVIYGGKTMTRRIIPNSKLLDALLYADGDTSKRNKYLIDHAPFKVGDSVAIAQSYEKILSEAIKNNLLSKDFIHPWGIDYYNTPGWRNKMFVRADIMPHHIRITNVTIEPLWNITDEDCYREGIYHVEWRQYPNPNTREYILHDLYTLAQYEGQFRDNWSDDDPECWAAESPRAAFMVLMSKMMGKKILIKNPLVYVYEFELSK